jgi:hypothetical protein
VVTVTAAETDITQALVDNHREFLAFLSRRVGDPAIAEDLLQAEPAVMPSVSCASAPPNR